MIVSKDITPDKNIYYIGALVIRILKDLNIDKIDILDVYKELNKKCNISITLLILTLDWLFILDIIYIKNYEVKLCL